MTDYVIQATKWQLIPGNQPVIGNLIAIFQVTKPMKTLFTFLFAAIAVSSSFSQGESKAVEHYNIKDHIALEGYDPVSYFTSKPLEGKSEYKYTYSGITYLFVNQANLEQFKKDPGKYEPAYGGWCAYAMGETGEKVKVDPETFKILDGRLYLFYNFWGHNTLDDWNENEKQLKEAADRNWSKIVN